MRSTAALFEAAAIPEPEVRAAVEALDSEERGQILAAVVGERDNRRHRPGAASRRSATASRSSPTTAPSATSSATGC